ncbi:MAG: hypothetical protein AAGJ86_02355 [Pseudomonadota bacterium]
MSAPAGSDDGLAGSLRVMLDFARWMMRSRLRQLLLMLVALVFFMPFAGAIAVAVTLASGFVVSIPMTAAVMVARTALILTNGNASDIAYAVLTVEAVYLAGVLLASLVLVRTRSLNFTLQLCAVAMVIWITSVHLVVGDVVAFWTPWVESFLQLMDQLSGAQQTFTQGSREEVVSALAVVMTGPIGASFWIAAAMALILGHSWWAGATGVEKDDRLGGFHQVWLGRTLAVALMIGGLIFSVAPSILIVNVAMALLLTFLLEGLSVTHWLVKRRGIMPGVLVLMYGLMFTPLAPFIIVGLCVVGYVDAWFNLLPGRIPAR